MEALEAELTERRSEYECQTQELSETVERLQDELAQLQSEHAATLQSHQARITELQKELDAQGSEFDIDLENNRRPSNTSKKLVSSWSNVRQSLSTCVARVTNSVRISAIAWPKFASNWMHASKRWPPARSN